MPIAFFSLLDDDGWVPLAIDATSPRFSWDDGGSLADAPVDVEATFGGAMWHSTKIDRSFGMTGLRCRPGFIVPPHHHSLRLLVIVFGGGIDVEVGDDRRHVGPGRFWVVDAGTPYVMTVGPEGATFTESFPIQGGELETCWHDGPGWIRR